MIFQEIAAQMGIDTYPEELEAIFAQTPTLPEDTRLQCAIKQRYLQGGYVHAFGGYYFYKAIDKIFFNRYISINKGFTVPLQSVKEMLI